MSWCGPCIRHSRRPDLVTVTYETICLERDGHVATLTLNRPERLNAFNDVMARELVAVCDEIDGDDSIRAVVVTGAGRAFCAGADLGRGEETFDAEARAGGLDDQPGGDGEDRWVNGIRRDGGGIVALRFFELTKPVIAAVNGPAVGVGITMTLPMDVRLLADGAKIGFVFARRGITPEACSSWFLPRLVGISQAARWCYAGRVLPASEMAAGGLGELVAPDRLLERASELAGEFAESAPVSVALTRRLLWRGLTFSHPMEAHRADSRAVQALGRTADGREGVTSFLEKRPPEWSLGPSGDLPDVFPDWSPPDFR